jgi:hypothetical protein
MKHQSCYTRLTVLRGNNEFHPFPKLRGLAYFFSGSIPPQAKPFPPSLRSLTFICHSTLDRATVDAPNVVELRIIGLMRTITVSQSTTQRQFVHVESVDLSKAYIRAPELAVLCMLLSQAPISDLKITSKIA